MPYPHCTTAYEMVHLVSREMPKPHRDCLRQNSGLESVCGVTVFVRDRLEMAIIWWRTKESIGARGGRSPGGSGPHLPFLGGTRILLKVEIFQILYIHPWNPERSLETSARTSCLHYFDFYGAGEVFTYCSCAICDLLHIELRFWP